MEWLHCEEIARGMFRDELAVVVVRSNGSRESYFVPATDVDQAGSRVRVSARHDGSIAWATLPTPDHVTIPVLPSSLS